MYLLAQVAVAIECPQHVTFAYAANLENFPAWFPGVLLMTAGDDLPFDAVGKLYREEFVLPMRGRRSLLVEVVDAVAPCRIVTEGRLAHILPRMEIAVRPTAPGACVVEWRMFSRTSSGLARWILLPLARRLMTLRGRRGLRRLKLQLETIEGARHLHRTEPAGAGGVAADAGRHPRP